MDTSLYKEISYKIQGFRVVSWLIAAVSLLLCLLIGIGCYILVIGMHGQEAFQEVPVHEERITVIEGRVKEPKAEDATQQIDFNEGTLSKPDEEGVGALAHLQHANKFLGRTSVSMNYEESPAAPEIHPNNYKTSFSMRYPVASKPTAPVNNAYPSDFFSGTQILDNFARSFNGQDEGAHHRFKRSIGFGILSYVPYLSYATFGKFLMNQVSEIANYNVEHHSFESRKLVGDPVANFLDGMWPQQHPQDKYPAKKTVKKSSAILMKEYPKVEATTKKYQPMVNQVPLSFVSEILRTLLNLMKEFLMKDHVMECLWYMFCQDVNQQASHSDLYGILARVNSVGLKVLTQSDKELRQTDALGDVWRSLTAWSPLQCDVMFPKCDGPKALEIVNEVAMGGQM